MIDLSLLGLNDYAPLSFKLSDYTVYIIVSLWRSCIQGNNWLPGDFTPCTWNKQGVRVKFGTDLLLYLFFVLFTSVINLFLQCITQREVEVCTSLECAWATLAFVPDLVRLNCLSNKVLECYLRGLVKTIGLDSLALL